MNQKQDFLFNPFNHQVVKPEKPAEPPATGVPVEDVPRLTAQNRAIFEALKEGPKTNRMLSQIALKYTSRLSEIRKWLKDWKPSTTLEKEALGGGLFEYRLVERSEASE